MKKYIYILCTLLIASLPSGLSAQKGSTPKKEAQDSTKKLTPYEKIFNKKRDVKSVSGVLTLHNVEGKLYIEMPITLVGRDFLMGSVIDRVSNPALAFQGQRASRPIQVCFTKTDSLVQVRIVPKPVLTDKSEIGVADAIKASGIPPVIFSSPILAYNRDSSAVVFEATSFFISGSKYIGTLNTSTMGGFVQKVSNFNKELSVLKGIEAYKNNIAVITDMTYGLTSYFMGMESGAPENITVELRTSLNLLPEDNFRKRFADYRIGTLVTEFENLGVKEQKSGYNYFVSRWRVEPSNVEKYNRGELTEPVKQIVFYVDTLFKPSWREAVKRGVLKWNKVFEKAGYKNVIAVKDYPSPAEDPSFSSSDNSYSCVKYAMIPSRNLSRQINIDPRNGEILSANIIFYADSPVTLQRERIYQTALAEPQVRGAKLPDSLMEESIEAAITKEMGLCLGLTPNLAASSWIPIDSLKSVTFTQREGISSSITDQIRYNFVAREADVKRGVKLILDEPGVYDIYAIDWLYRNYSQFNDEYSEKDFLRTLISKKIKDRRFYYGREQNGGVMLDPRSLTEDLGDDKIKAAKYGTEVLKYISDNGASWVNREEVDEVYRELFPDFIFLKLYDFYRAILVNIGGIEINESYEGDGVPSYKVVDKSVQRESLMFLLEQCDDFGWLDNKEMLKMSGMNGSFSEYYANNLARIVFSRLSAVEFAYTKSDDPYTPEMMLNDIISFSIKNLRKGDEISDAQKSVLVGLTQLLLKESNLPAVAKAKESRSFALSALINGEESRLPDTFNISLDIEDIGAFGPVTGIKYLVNSDRAGVYYKNLLKLRDELKKVKRKVENKRSSDLVEYLLLAIEKGLVVNK